MHIQHVAFDHPDAVKLSDQVQSEYAVRYGDDGDATLLATASIGVAFVARPFGGLLFGHFGDRYGRRPMLFASLVMMGGATTLIGVLPGHDTWAWAPLLLVVLRLVQGLAVAGENTGS